LIVLQPRESSRQRRRGDNNRNYNSYSNYSGTRSGSQVTLTFP